MNNPLKVIAVLFRTVCKTDYHRSSISHIYVIVGFRKVAAVRLKYIPSGYSVLYPFSEYIVYRIYMSIIIY